MQVSVSQSPPRDTAVPNDILKGIAFQKGGDGLRDGFLARLHMMVTGADLIAGTAQVIAEVLLDVSLDFFLGLAITSQIDSTCSCFCALDSFRVVVGYLSG